MNERVLILRDAVVKITQMLAGSGIAVSQRGINAYVECDDEGRPTRVNLPYLPDNATEELCLAIQGFLDHEVAHILFSDFSLIGIAAKEGCKSMLNMLEDTRIEREMAKRFSGAGHNLSVTGKFFLDKYVQPMLDEAIKSGDANRVVGVLMVPLIRAMAGQFVFQEFMSDKMHLVQSVYDQIADLEAKIQTAASTHDCLDLAKEIEARLRFGDDGDSGRSKPGEKKEGDDSSASHTSSSVDKDDKDDKDEPKKPTPDPESEGGEDTDTSSPKDETEEGEDKPTPDGEEGEEGEDETEEESSVGGEESASDEDDGSTGSSAGEGEEEGGESNERDEGDAKNSAAEALWEAIDKENANGFDENMSRMISESAADAAKSSDYLVYTKDADLVEPLHVGSAYNSRMLTDLIDKVEHMVGPLQKDLERAIAARSLATWESGRRSGRLHAANLSRLATGDNRVFRKRHETTSKDVAVELVIDASGSMSGSRIHLATQSAYALSSVLERIGIQHEVICFTTGEPYADRMTLMLEGAKIGRPFSRIESLYMPIIKGFNERLRTEVKARFGWLPNSRILRNNVDGECVEIAARRLLSRRESGKVMIVLSDGEPLADGNMDDLKRHLKQVVNDVTKRGVKVVGIGIQTRSVEEFYPKNLVINKVEELPERVVKELRHLLIS